MTEEAEEGKKVLLITPFVVISVLDDLRHLAFSRHRDDGQRPN